jgi:hypothetical protein
MIASTSLSVFHQWLLVEPASPSPACAIILHGDATVAGERMVQEIAEYLNEYDDDSDGGWLPATEELVGKISQDANHCQLLGLGENLGQDSEGFAKVLTALGRRGHVVFRAPGASLDKVNLENTFHAGIGQAAGSSAACHLILNPNLIEPKCMAHIIGDVFLEWFYCETHRNPAIYEIR